VLEQRLRFSDSVKDQEKALAKLKIQQELSETLAEEAVYRVAINEEYQESEGESVHNYPTGFGNITDTSLHDQESYFPTQPFVTQCLSNVSQSSVPVTQPLVPETQSLVPVVQPSVPVTQPPSITQFADPVTQASVSVPYPFSSGLQLSTTVSQSSPLDVHTSAPVCSKPINTCCTALAFSHAQPAFIFDMYPNMSVSVKTTHCQGHRRASCQVRIL